MARKIAELTKEELGKLFPIIISEHNPNWVNLFVAEQELIERKIGRNNIVNIHHFGSTSIPNIHAKPTIDILLEVVDDVKTDEIITKFQDIGYHYSHQPQNPPPHMMFMKGYTISGFVGQAYHVHVRYAGDWDELYFRDYVRQHPDIAEDYARLKLKLKARHEFDREAYTEGKTEFVRTVTHEAKQKLKNNFDI